MAAILTAEMSSPAKATPTGSLQGSPGPACSMEGITCAGPTPLAAERTDTQDDKHDEEGDLPPAPAPTPIRPRIVGHDDSSFDGLPNEQVEVAEVSTACTEVSLPDNASSMDKQDSQKLYNNDSSMTTARHTSLTPKVPEQLLEMPDDDEENDAEAQYDEGQENILMAALSGLTVESNIMPLRGIPAPEGKHTRFDEDCNPIPSPDQPPRTVLRGLPVATGTHTRFD